MKKLLILLLLFGFVSCNNNSNKDSLLAKGIPYELAKYRKSQVSDVHYNLMFNIPKARNEEILSTLLVDLTIHDLKHPLYFDFNEDKSFIKSVEVNDQLIEIDHQEEHLIISQDYFTVGRNQINIDFTAGELSLNRNEDYLYTLLVPDRASTLFPCFDQPNIKAEYTLNIKAPKDWSVLCGAPIKEITQEGESIQYSYERSDRMSTYLFSFVAGEFNEVDKVIEEQKMKLLYRENDPEKLKASLDEIFNLHKASLDFMEDYTQYKFPFKKFDFATIPGFQYGGMEHTGAIQYRESTLFLDSSATERRKLSRGKLIAHETAHMWFGNLVTMDWFDDVWLKEVFANFLADKIASPTFPEINHNLNFMSEHYASAYSEDRTQGAVPIKQHLDNLKNAGTIYSRTIYNKAPIMMRQLEAVLGEEAFREGMRNYIKAFANDNADWSDLVALLDEQTDEDIKQWSKVWVYESGRPIIEDDVTYNDGKITSFKISQQAEDGSENIWPQTFSIGLVYKDSVVVQPIKLKSKEQSISKVVGLPKPDAIIYNYDGFGYGVFPLNESDISSIPVIKDDVARGYSYINLYENVLSGNISPELALKVLVNASKTEHVELILSNVSGYMSSIFWKYINPSKRKQIAKEIENSLKERLLAENVPSGIKKTIFNTYKSVAFSEEGKDVLYKIWDKSLQIPNLNLNENNYTSLAATLVLYGHKEESNILQKALHDITNPDRKKRFEFLVPSLSSSEEERDNFMLSLSDAKNREKESWVLSALSNIHHPLRHNSSEKHLKMCLEMVEEIQLTGDIFFPKGWLNATIGNYSSEYAYKTVEEFLNENKEFPKALKNKLLQSADGVYRGQKIIEDN